jgi:hypothetical protein
MLDDYRDFASHVFQFLENIVFKRIKTISWIKHEFNTIQKLLFMH